MARIGINAWQRERIKLDLEKILSLVLQKPHSAFFYTPPYYEKSRSYLLTDPKKLIKISYGDDLEEHFSLVEEYLAQGYPGYALINYEAAYLLEEKLKNYLSGEKKTLLTFIFFDDENFFEYKSSILKQKEFSLDKFQISNFQLNTSKKNYSSAVKKIKKHIEEGNTYQINYTLKGKFNFDGDIEEFFKCLSFNQSAKYSAFINNGEEIIISISPELFFKIRKDKLQSMPMKGTAKRGIEPSSDSLIKYSLQNDDKNRAENLMIVDLLRNDLGRVCKYGTVKTDKMFEVEKYESLYQMVSTVNGKLNKPGLIRIIKNLFPCGSITGAPKISSMRIIKEIESEERGIYTGAIGLLKKDESIFNVPIRTLVINKKSSAGEVGLGSGVVWDSNPDEEYEEILLKGNFIKSPAPYFEIIETMLVEQGKIIFLSEHLKRMKAAAQHFLFLYDEEKIISRINSRVKKLDHQLNYKIRLLLNKWGKIKLAVSEEVSASKAGNIFISDKTINSQNTFQYFKTTNRKVYNSEFKKYSSKGFTDVIFINEKNQITEGAISNIFICKGGMIYTPPIESGILNGIYRKHLLYNNINIKEEALYKDDLLTADEVFITNAVKKIIKIKKLFLNESEFKEYSGA